MREITTIGLDLAKNIFQVHGVDEAGEVVVRKQLRRAQVLGFFAALSRCNNQIARPECFGSDSAAATPRSRSARAVFGIIGG